MQHDVKMYLYVIVNSINSIYDFLGEDSNFDKYETNKLLRRAVEREL
jgi:uncharacterized protein with HEPN domain